MAPSQPFSGKGKGSTSARSTDESKISKAKPTRGTPNKVSLIKNLLQSLDLALEYMNKLRDHVTWVAEQIKRHAHTGEESIVEEANEIQEDPESCQDSDQIESEAGEAFEAPRAKKLAEAPTSAKTNKWRSVCEHSLQIKKEPCGIFGCDAPADIEIEVDGYRLLYCYEHELVADCAAKASEYSKSEYSKAKYHATKNDLAKSHKKAAKAQEVSRARQAHEAETAADPKATPVGFIGPNRSNVQGTKHRVEHFRCRFEGCSKFRGICTRGRTEYCFDHNHGSLTESLRHRVGTDADVCAAKHGQPASRGQDTNIYTGDTCARLQPGVTQRAGFSSLPPFVGDVALLGIRSRPTLPSLSEKCDAVSNNDGRSSWYPECPGYYQPTNLSRRSALPNPLPSSTVDPYPSFKGQYGSPQADASQQPLISGHDDHSFPTNWHRYDHVPSIYDPSYPLPNKSETPHHPVVPSMYQHYIPRSSTGRSPLFREAERLRGVAAFVDPPALAKDTLAITEKLRHTSSEVDDSPLSNQLVEEDAGKLHQVYTTSATAITTSTKEATDEVYGENAETPSKRQRVRPPGFGNFYDVTDDDGEFGEAQTSGESASQASKSLSPSFSRSSNDSVSCPSSDDSSSFPFRPDSGNLPFPNPVESGCLVANDPSTNSARGVEKWIDSNGGHNFSDNKANDSLGTTDGYETIKTEIPIITNAPEQHSMSVAQWYRETYPEDTAAAVAECQQVPDFINPKQEKLEAREREQHQQQQQLNKADQPFPPPPPPPTPLPPQPRSRSNDPSSCASGESRAELMAGLEKSYRERTLLMLWLQYFEALQEEEREEERRERAELEREREGDWSSSDETLVSE